MWDLVRLTGGFIPGRRGGKSTQATFKLNFGDCGHGAGIETFVPCTWAEVFHWGCRTARRRAVVGWRGKWGGERRSSLGYCGQPSTPWSSNPFFFFLCPPSWLLLPHPLAPFSLCPPPQPPPAAHVREPPGRVRQPTRFPVWAALCNRAVRTGSRSQRWGCSCSLVLGGEETSFRK